MNSRNPTINDRTLEQSLMRAEKTREELPLVAQVWPSDWDVCILADEVYKLRGQNEILRKRLNPPQREKTEHERNEHK